jgi:hypothetical protein
MTTRCPRITRNDPEFKKQKALSLFIRMFLGALIDNNFHYRNSGINMGRKNFAVAGFNTKRTAMDRGIEIVDYER